MGCFVELSVRVGIPLALLVLAHFTGAALERRHYASIREREVLAFGTGVKLLNAS